MSMSQNEVSEILNNRDSQNKCCETKTENQGQEQDEIQDKNKRKYRTSTRQDTGQGKTIYNK